MNAFKPWAAFLFVGGVAWGTSFLWIKIALEEIGPFILVALRLAFAVSAAWIYILIRKIPFPREFRLIGMMAFLGLINTAIPFTLISWGETRIDSGLAGILNGTMPLFTTVIAHFALADDRFTPAKAIGLLVGFGGLALLLSPELNTGGISGDLLGQAAVLGGAFLYAISTVIIRHTLKGQPPIIISAVSLTTASVIIWTVTPIVESPFTPPARQATWVAAIWLGLIGTTGAYLAYFYLINIWGPTRSSMVTYVFPLVAVALGVIFLGESLDWRIIVGGTAVIAGILIVNWRSLVPILLKPASANSRGAAD